MQPEGVGEQPLRVALVTRDLSIGGAQRDILKLCRTICARDVSLSVHVLVRDERHEFLPAIRASGVPVSISPFRRHHPASIRWLAAEVRKREAEVVHSLLWVPDLYSALAKKMYGGFALVGSELGDRSLARHGRTRALVDRLLVFRTADVLCANSEFGRGLLANGGCPTEKLHVIHNAVDLGRVDGFERAKLRQELGWPEQSRIVGTASRLVDYKGIDVLIRAVAAAKSTLPIYCAILGDGPERNHLEQLAASLGIGHRVAFLGVRAPSEPLIKDFDIAVMPTRTNSEHCSNSILEFMACGKPVIATRRGGNPELVVENDTGYLVPHDDPAALCARLEDLLEHPERARQMGARGRERVEQQFQMHRMAAQHVQLWRSAACGRS